MEGQEAKKAEIEIETIQIREELDLKPCDEVKEVVIDPLFLNQTIKIGAGLMGKDREDLIKFLKHSLDVFAWAVEDIEGISSEVAEYCLNVSPEFTPIQQRPQVFKPEKETVVREEVKKLLKAKIIM